MKPSGLIKEELWRILMKMGQFRHKITKIRSSTFWMSGKSTDSRRRPTQSSRPVSFKPITASQARINPKNVGFCRRRAPFTLRSEVKGKPGGNPEPGDRLRFVFVFVSCVPCVRAGEAKLRVRARCRVFLLGRPRLWEVLLRSSRPLCEAQGVV